MTTSATPNSVTTTDHSATPRTKTWRVVDIVVAALIAVAGGVLFWAWSAGFNMVSPLWQTAFPPLGGLFNGGWMIPAVLGPLLIRKPGAALFCELVAATGELIMGSPYGLSVLISGALQGAAAELVFAVLRYRVWNLTAAMLAGGAAGLICGLNDITIGWYVEFSVAHKLTYVAFSTLSGVLIAGVVSWLLVRGLSATGALSAFTSRHAHTESTVGTR